MFKRFKFYAPDGVPGGDPNLPTGDDGNTPPAPPALPLTDGITLSRAEYSQMMGQFVAMQQKIEQMSQPSTPAEPAQPALDTAEIDRLTNSQMMEMILQQVQSQVGQPLLNSIMTLAVKEELRDTQAKYTDFNTYKDEVYTEAQANSHLSLEQAYLIVKARKTGGTLPPVVPKPAAPAPAPPVGTKPGIGLTSAVPTTNLSVRAAAEAALKSLQLD